MTIGMLALLFVPFDLNKDVLMLFSSTYGAVITYFFTRKGENKEEKEEK
jgi:uncharacterized membrane protein